MMMHQLQRRYIQTIIGLILGIMLLTEADRAYGLPPAPLVMDPAAMDLDGNGLPDVWEAAFGVFGLQPDDDDDLDGVSNLDESRAGTDPLDAASCFILRTSNSVPDYLTVMWPDISGRSSVLQSTSSLTNNAWTNESVAVTTSNDIYSAEVPLGGAVRFFRSVNTDLDTDSDGVQDWIEVLAEFDPADSESALGDRDYDTDGDGTPDITLEGDLAAFNEIYNEAALTNRPTEAQAARFLMQATFGPTYSDVTNLQAVGIDQWITDQMALPPYYTSPYIDAILVDYENRKIGITNEVLQGYSSNDSIVFGNNFMTAWAMTAIKGEDQLRQRVAFALSQILVVSRMDATLANKPGAIADYYDTLLDHAFGNYLDLLRDVTFHADMGIYLSHLGNQKADEAINRYPDENYAREIMQLFTIGLWELNPDGTRTLDTYGEPIPTYNNEEITEMARVFTGLSWGGYSWPWGWASDENLQVPMDMNVDPHDFGEKTLLNGYVIPARTPGVANGLQDVEDALTHLFNHPNLGPFIGRQLIQFLVTSNPSTGYVARISAVFDDNGAGVRGDLAAVVRAILLDPEARNPMEHLSAVQYGGLREPAIRTMHLARVQNLARFDYLLWWDWSEFAANALQEPMYSPSVFNFYRPDYRLPGQLAEGGHDSPVFGITDSYSAISFPNHIWGILNKGFYKDPQWGYHPNYNFPPDWSEFVPLAGDVPALVDRAVLLFCEGSMSTENRSLLISSVAQLDETTEQTERIRLAVYLAMMSPEGAILK